MNVRFPTRHKAEPKRLLLLLLCEFNNMQWYVSLNDGSWMGAARCHVTWWSAANVQSTMSANELVSQVVDDDVHVVQFTYLKLFVFVTALTSLTSVVISCGIYVSIMCVCELVCLSVCVVSNGCWLWLVIRPTLIGCALLNDLADTRICSLKSSNCRSLVPAFSRSLLR